MVLECLIYNEKIRISLDIWFFGIILIEFVIEEDVWLVDDVVDIVNVIKKKMIEKEFFILNVNVIGVLEEVMIFIKFCVNYDKLLCLIVEDVLKCVFLV